MEQKINALRELMEQRISQINSKETLAAFWQEFLGKKGSVADLMKGLGAVAKEDRPAMGKVINDFKVQVEQQYKTLSEKMEQLELQARNRKEAVDITLPSKKQALGHMHPLTLVKNEMINVYVVKNAILLKMVKISLTRLSLPAVISLLMLTNQLVCRNTLCAILKSLPQKR